MNKEETGSVFAPSASYATARYDAMTSWCVIAGGTVMRSRFASELAAQEVCGALNALDAEVRRLRSGLDLSREAAVARAEYCAKLKGEAHDSKGWRKRAEDAERANMALRVEVLRLKSHNNRAERRAQRGAE